METRQRVLRQESDAAVIVPPGFPAEPVAIVAPPGSVVAGILDGVLRRAAGQPGVVDAADGAVELAVTEIVPAAPEVGSEGVESPWAGYAPDIEAAHARLKAAGIPVDDQITDEPGVRWFGFMDPDGNRLEVCWWPEQS